MFDSCRLWMDEAVVTRGAKVVAENLGAAEATRRKVISVRNDILEFVWFVSL